MEQRQRYNARVAFEQLAANEFDKIPRDGRWAVSVASLCYTAAFLGDVERARQLHALLAPYDGRAIVAGRAAISFGAASRFLGLAAAAMCAWEQASGHFQGAIDENERMGAWPYVARSQYESGRTLVARGRQKDRNLAVKLLDDADRIARELGIRHVLEGVANVKADKHFG